MTVVVADIFWTLPRTAGVIIVGVAALLAVVSFISSLRGDVRAVEAMFRDIDIAVGNTRTLRVMTMSYGVWSIAVLTGFTVLAVELWNRGVRLMPTLALVGLVVFTTAWVIEAAFHSSVTVWAVRLLEQGEEVPALFHELKRWLNYWLQILVNPISLLSFVGFAVVSMQAEIIPSWAGWTLIVWSGVFVFFPLPLAIAPAALFFGVILLING